MIDFSSINLVDVLLEGAKALIMIGLVFVLWGSGRKYPALSSETSWFLLLFGFALMSVGFLVDWSDEIIDYEASDMLATIQSMVEEITLIGGLVFATIGIGQWFAYVGRSLGADNAKLKDRAS